VKPSGPKQKIDFERRKLNEEEKGILGAFLLRFPKWTPVARKLALKLEKDLNLSYKSIYKWWFDKIKV